MYSSKLSISKRFSMPVTWNILYILPCSVNVRFTTLLKNQVEWIFQALLSCQHLYESCWFSWDILSLTKSFPENFKLLSSWDLLSRFLRLYITEFFCLQHLNLTITLHFRFIQWQVCKSFGRTYTSVNYKVLQMFSSGVQQGHSYLMGRRCLFSLGWPPF